MKLTTLSNTVASLELLSSRVLSREITMLALKNKFKFQFELSTLENADVDALVESIISKGRINSFLSEIGKLIEILLSLKANMIRQQQESDAVKAAKHNRIINSKKDSIRITIEENKKTLAECGFSVDEIKKEGKEMIRLLGLVTSKDSDQVLSPEDIERYFSLENDNACDYFSILEDNNKLVKTLDMDLIVVDDNYVAYVGVLTSPSGCHPSERIFINPEFIMGFENKPSPYDVPRNITKNHKVYIYNTSELNNY